MTEKKMETTRLYQGIDWGLYRDHGKESGNYYTVIGNRLGVI